MTALARYKELRAQQPVPRCRPYSEFLLSTDTVIARDLRYPRAGVRRQSDGKWLLQIWYAPKVVRNDEEAMTYSSPLGAFHGGQHEVHAARAQQHPAGQLWLRGTPQEVTA